jgi:hypothetical protein
MAPMTALSVLAFAAAAALGKRDLDVSHVRSVKTFRRDGKKVASALEVRTARSR